MNGNKLVQTLAGLVQLGCMVGLAGIALKRNNDCYHAECKLLDEQCKRYTLELDNVLKDAKIRVLEKENKKLKSEKEES